MSIAILLAASAAGCSDDPPRVVGETCELSSECDDPLVCRLDRCRRECVTFRDCAAGLRCVLDSDGRGACLLPEELSCALTSECRERHPSLVCAEGVCTNECVEDRDCPSGAACITGADGNACVEPVTDLCVYDTECEPPYSCAEDQRCRLECVNDRDCQDPRVCVANLCQLPDGGGP